MASSYFRRRAGVYGLLICFAALLGGFVAGCFPVELDVSNGAVLIARAEGVFVFDAKSGAVTRVASAAEKAQPITARFAPNGKDALIVSKVPGESFDDEFNFVVTPRGGGAGHEIFHTPMAIYAAYSPDGSQVAVLRASDKEDPQFKQKVPEVVLVPAAGGEPRVIAHHVGPLVRWFADSKRLLVFDLAKKSEDSRYEGSLSALDVTTGKLTPIATAAVKDGAFVDLSPDNHKVLFTALSAVKVGGGLDAPQGSSMKLFEVDLVTGAVEKFDLEPTCAVFSPNGKQILLTLPPEGLSFDTVSLQVADESLKNLTPVAPDGYKPMSLGGDEVYFPGWLDEKTVFYFAHRAVYGTSAKNVLLYAVGIDGKNRRCLQPQIDAGVAKLASE